MTAALAYLGPPGTFSEQAAIEFDPAADRVPFPTITATCESIFAADADRAILPLENSLAGSIGETHDLILQHHELSLAGELILPIEHCLILPASAPAGEIDLIISHPQPLRQCHQYLQRRFPGVRTEATLSTAEAVAQAVQHGPGAAAIAPRRAAELHGGRIAETGIEDDKRNATRFIVLARGDAEPTGRDKTTVTFSTEDRPGALYSALQVFAEKGINLTRIESRPAKERIGVYLFLVDCDGHRRDEPFAAALEELDRRVARLRVIGSYPAHAP